MVNELIDLSEPQGSIISEAAASGGRLWTNANHSTLADEVLLQNSFVLILVGIIEVNL
jgi:hypothetical protein